MFDDLLLLLIFVPLLAMLGWGLGIAGFVQARRARTEIRELRAALSALAGRAAGVPDAVQPDRPVVRDCCPRRGGGDAPCWC